MDNLRKWVDMPNEKGWYWFDGTIEWDAYPDDEWHSPAFQKLKSVVKIPDCDDDCEEDDRYMRVFDDYEVFGGQAEGVWFGPLVPPWGIDDE